MLASATRADFGGKMSENFFKPTRITKPVTVSGRGVVASQNSEAARLGAEVLARGGNAIDAAVTTGLALAALEPWMTGLGGGGQMVIWLAREKRARVVDFGMIAAKALDIADYPLTGGKGSDLFAWPLVKDDRNIFGYHSIAVPGEVAGLSLALKTFGTISWREAIAPAIACADKGLNADWFATLMIASSAALLAQFPESAKTYLPGGVPASTDYAGKEVRIRLGNLAATLKRLHDAGPEEFYEGETAKALVADLQAGGSRIGLDDLRSYKARIVDSLDFPHGDATIHATPGLTAGPTLKSMLRRLAGKLHGKAPDAKAYRAYADALRDSYAERFATMGDGITPPTSTTNLCAVDSEGNMVALTKTLLSLFGSRVMLPKTGLLMNNGIMWFDPTPGGPNSLGPGKRPLTNMCPIAVSRNGAPAFAVGASGGRRILASVAQLASFQIDFGMTLEAAFHQPRIDHSGGDEVVADWHLPDDVIAALSEGHKTRTEPRSAMPQFFACPTGVAFNASQGPCQGMGELGSPWAGAAAA